MAIVSNEIRLMLFLFTERAAQRKAKDKETIKGLEAAEEILTDIGVSLERGY